MWRTIIVNTAERIRLSDNWIVLEADGDETKVPVNELYSIVIDNPNLTLSVNAINALTENNVHIIYCGKKHLPQSIVLPYNTHYSPLTVVQKQLGWSKKLCNQIWQKIVKAKIENQAAVIKMCGCSMEVYDHLLCFANEVDEGDTKNREGLAAKMFFRELYGSEFIRMNDDAINHALNYGYAIIRSAVAKTLCAYGYNTVIGLHHIGRQNTFNLADDLMEPFRPIVDLWVDLNHEDLFEELTKDNRRKLVNLVNETMSFNGKNMKVRNAIDRCVSSLTSSLLADDSALFKTAGICNYTLDEMKRGEEE